MLPAVAQFALVTARGVNRVWIAYGCRKCGGAIVATAPAVNAEITEIYPVPRELSDDLPPRVREYLGQAVNSLSSPSGAVMLAASAVDSMLKAKSLTEGTLYTRIDKAAEDHLITPDMAKWAHEVRLDANDQRHADDAAPLPGEAQAKKCVDFAIALGELLFVLPARIQRGISGSKTSAV